MNIYDEWEIRELFFDPEQYSLLFFVDDLSNPGALIPLQKSLNDNSLSFFASPFLERNRCFYKTGCESAVIHGYLGLPRNTKLDDIAMIDPICTSEYSKASDPAYFLEKTTINYTDDNSLYHYLPKNIRENIRKIRKKISSCELEEEHTDLPDAVTSIKGMLQGSFGADSWLESKKIHDAFLQLDSITEKIGGEVVSVSLKKDALTFGSCISVIYRDTFYMLMAGTNRSANLSGVGSYLYYYCMNLAFSLGCSRIDTGIGDCGWKERWKLQKEQQSIFNLK